MAPVRFAGAAPGWGVPVRRASPIRDDLSENIPDSTAAETWSLFLAPILSRLAPLLGVSKGDFNEHTVNGTAN